MSLLIPLLLLLAFPPDPFSGGKPISSGFCVGQVWVQLRPGEKAFLYRGVDTIGYRVLSNGKLSWSTGSYGNGFSPTEKGDGIGPIAFRESELVARRIRYFSEGPELERGYAVARSDHLNTGEEIFYFDSNTAIFTGPVFSGTDKDRAFFNRMSAGETAEQKCAMFWKRQNG